MLIHWVTQGLASNNRIKPGVDLSNFLPAPKTDVWDFFSHHNQMTLNSTECSTGQAAPLMPGRLVSVESLTGDLRRLISLSLTTRYPLFFWAACTNVLQICQWGNRRAGGQGGGWGHTVSTRFTFRYPHMHTNAINTHLQMQRIIMTTKKNKHRVKLLNCRYNRTASF